MVVRWVATKSKPDSNGRERKGNNEPLADSKGWLKTILPPYLFMDQDRRIGDNRNKVVVAYVFLFVSDGKEALI